MTSVGESANGPAAPTVVRPALQRYGLLGSWVNDYTVATLLQDVDAAVASERPWLITNHNVNSLSLLQRDAVFRSFFERSDRIFVDGTGALLLTRMLGAPLRQEHRVAVLDWIWPLCALAEDRGWSLVHVGGTGASLDAARAAILERHPALRLTTVDGFFDVTAPDQVSAVLDEIREARPHVLLVGMGMPRQELWLQHCLDDLPTSVVITVGGILSFIGGERPTPPRWLGRLGLEWFYRLATEPARLWRRYLLEPWYLVPAFVRELRQRR